MQTKGQPYFHHISCDHWKCWGWIRLCCKTGRRRRDGTLSWWRGQSISQSGRNRSAYGVYHSIWQGGQTVPTEKQKLFLGCGSPNRPMESEFKHQKWDGKKGRLDPSEASCHSVNIPRRDPLNIKTSGKTLFLNPEALTHWSGPENIVSVRINGDSSWAHLDNGSTINAVTPEFIEACSLDISPLSELVNGMMGINGLGGFSLYPWAMLSYGIR